MPDPNRLENARPYGGIAATDRRRARREKLIAAGYDLFGTVGFNHTKIERVCAQAGVGIRSLYDEFGQLEQLFVAVYDDVIDRAYGALEMAVSNDPSQSPAQLLKLGIKTYLHQMLDDPRSGRIVSIESGRLDLFMGGHRNETLNKFAALNRRIILQDADLDPEAASVWSIMLAGAINEIVITALLADDPPDIDHLASIAAHIWSNSLGLADANSMN